MRNRQQQYYQEIIAPITAFFEYFLMANRQAKVQHSVGNISSNHTPKDKDINDPN